MFTKFKRGIHITTLVDQTLFFFEFRIWQSRNLCESEDYKTHEYIIVHNEEGKRVKRPKLEDQIYAGKCSFFTGALVTLDGMDRTEEL